MKPRPTISNNGDREREFLAIWDAENIRPTMQSPACSWWLNAGLRSALQRDAVDALHDAKHLVALLEARCTFIQKLADVHAGEPLVVDGESWAIVGGKKL